MEKFKLWFRKNYIQVAIIFLSFLALIGLFLPYEKSIGKYHDELVENYDDIYIKEADLKNEDVVNISILENFKIYKFAYENSEDNEWVYQESLLNIILTIIIIVSILLIIIFSIFKKSVFIIIFNILLAISSLLMNADIVSRGVMPSENYTFGISYYLYIIVAVLILVCVIIQIYKNKREKKENIENKNNTKTKIDAKKEKKTNKIKEMKFLETLKHNQKNLLILIIIILSITIVILGFLLFSKTNNTNHDSSERNEIVKNDGKENVIPDYNKNHNNLTYDFSGEENNVKFNIKNYDSDNMIIIGKNNNSNVVDIEFEVEFYDNNNAFIGSETTSIDAISNNSNFALELNSIPKNYKNYKVYVDIDESDDTSFTNNLKLNHNNNGENIVIQVKNDKEKSISYIEVAVIYYKDNKIIGYDYDYNTDVKSGRSANFELNYPYDLENYENMEFDDYDVFINEAFTYSWE